MRTESDSMGPMQVPDTALYGASTQRAVLNFPISGHRLPPGFTRALGLIKWAAAKANVELKRLDPKLAKNSLKEPIRPAVNIITDNDMIPALKKGKDTTTRRNP